jgi:hypothetical protein
MTDILVEQFPVHSSFIGGEIKSTGIAFEDYTRMGMERHSLSSWRRYAVPVWAINDDQLCAVLARSMEERAGFRKGQAGMDKERMARAQQQLEKMRPELVARIDRLCARFVAAKREGADNVTVALYGQKVEEVDTQLRLLSDISKILAGVVYFYWRCGYTSVETGQQLGLKPPHIRCMLFKLIETAAELGYAPPEPIARRHAPRLPKAVREARTPQQVLEARAQSKAKQRITIAEKDRALTAQVIEMRKAGRFTVDIARELGLGANGCAVVNEIMKQAGLN